MQIFLLILRKTFGYGKKQDMIALSQFQETGISKQHVIRAIKKLVEMKLIIAEKGNKVITTYQINKHYSEWEALPKKATLPKKAIEVAEKGNASLPKKAPTKETTTKETTTKETDLSSPAGEEFESGEWISKKRRKIEGKRLESFILFWEAFDYKKGRAEAIDAWLDIPQLTMTLVANIVEAAKNEAKGRSELIRQSLIPKMAQGWITARRWEDEQVNPAEDKKEMVPRCPKCGSGTKLTGENNDKRECKGCSFIFDFKSEK